MKSIVSLFTVLALLTVTSHAQEVVPATGAGARAVLFSFAGLSFLGAGNFNGGVGGGYFLSDAMAVRGGVQFASASQDNPANPGVNQQGIDGSRSALTYGVSAALEIRMAKRRVSPYFGGGVLFTVSSTELNSAEVGNPPPTQTVTKNSAGGLIVNGTTYTAGTTLTVFGMMGVEFFLYNEMSLAAEYRLGYGSTSRPDQEISNGTTTTTTTTKVGGGSTLGFSNGGALTLSVYF